MSSISALLGVDRTSARAGARRSTPRPVVAALLALWHFRLIRKRERAGCFRAFLGNHWLGLAIFAGVVADFGWRFNAWPQWPG